MSINSAAKGEYDMKKRLLATILMAVLCVAIGTSACLFAACGIITGDTETPQETPETPSEDNTNSFDAREVTEEDVALFKDAVSASLSYEGPYTTVDSQKPASYYDSFTVSYDPSSGYIVTRQVNTVEDDDDKENPVTYEVVYSVYDLYSDDTLTEYEIVSVGEQIYYANINSETNVDDSWDDGYSNNEDNTSYVADSIERFFDVDTLEEVTTPAELKSYIAEEIFGNDNEDDLDSISMSVKGENGTTIFTFADDSEGDFYNHREFYVCITDGKITSLSTFMYSAGETDPKAYISISISYAFDSSLWPSDDDFAAFKEAYESKNVD